MGSEARFWVAMSNVGRDFDGRQGVEGEERQRRFREVQKKHSVSYNSFGIGFEPSQKYWKPAVVWRRQMESVTRLYGRWYEGPNGPDCKLPNMRARSYRDWGRNGNNNEDMSERFGYSVDGIEYDFKVLYGVVGYNTKACEMGAAVGDRATTEAGHNAVVLLIVYTFG